MTKYIRNFCIIAHINHGKSTFSDRIIEICKKKKLKKNQQRILDNMELEKEKGITIKAQCVNLKFNYKNNIFKLNLIDTPGHVDFSYEVSKSLYVCEGAILLIDIRKGIQSQTLNNYNIAKSLKIKILIVINKIDIKNINIKKIKKQIKKKLNYNNKIFICSSKTGFGIKKIIKNIIKIIPHPKLNINKSLLGLIIDSYFNNYLGTFFLIKIKSGYIKLNNNIKISNIKKKYNVDNIIINTPNKKKINILKCGEVGWITCKIKKINKNFIGNIIYNNNNKKIDNKKIIKKIKPQIFASIFPKENNNFNNLKISLQKLQLNDPSLTYEIEKSTILGFGFKCGFLGILHIEITKERLKREYNIEILIINPTVIFIIKNKNNKKIYIKDTDEIQFIKNIKYIKEPIVICNIKSNKKYLGNIINICNTKRGKLKNIKYINKNNVSLKYKIPLLEIITNLSNELKSITQGYCNYKYKFYKYKKSNITLLKVIINNKIIYGLSKFIHKNNIKKESIRIINILKKYINKQLFNITIQISCNNKIICRTNIKALRKNVISKCYGGDITRKKKLINKQKKGKKKMEKIGNVLINPKIFSKILKLN